MATKHLFKTTEQIQTFYPFGKIKFHELEPDLDLVEKKYLRNDILDDTTFESLMDKADAGTTAGAEWDELIRLCRNPIAKLTALYHLDEANVDYSSVGLLVARTDKSVPASDNRTKSLRLSLMHKTQDMFGLLVQYLEGNTAVFTDWATSTERKKTLVKDARTFSRYYPIDENRWIFRKIEPFINEVETTYLEELIGSDYVDELRDELYTDSLTEDNELLLEKLMPVICNYAMLLAIPRLSIDMSPRGIILFSNERGGYDEAFTPAPDNRVQLLMNKADTTANNYACKVTDFLNENASETKYRTYFSGPAYQDPNIDINDFGNDPDDEDRNGYYAG